MSRKLFAFLLSELNVVRITCAQCKKVCEMTTQEMGAQYASPLCPICRHPFTMPGIADNPFVQLSASIETLKKHASRVGIEFVLPGE